MEKLVGFLYNNVEYIYERNIQGDILGIYKKDDLTKVAEYVYDAYGNHRVINYTEENIGDINPIRYRGYYYDQETKLYYLNSRYYSPEIGRFISPDTLSILDETKAQINGLNLYMYCNDNPVMWIDPSGMDWWNPFTWNWEVIGVVAAAVAVTAACIAVSVATCGAGAVVGAMATGLFAGAVIGGGFETASQIYNNGWNPNDWDFKSIGMAMLSGGVAGAISAIPGLNMLGTALVGGASAVIGGVINGDVTNFKSAGMFFSVGVAANVTGSFANDIFAHFNTSKIMQMGAKQKSLTVQGMLASVNKSFGKGAYRNAFKHVGSGMVKELVKQTNKIIQIGVYSSITSAFLSTFATIFM